MSSKGAKKWLPSGQQSGKKKAMGSKGAIGGPLGDKLNLTLGISELHLKSKKILHVLNGSSEVYTRYFKVVDEQRKKRS